MRPWQWRPASKLIWAMAAIGVIGLGNSNPLWGDEKTAPAAAAPAPAAPKATEPPAATPAATKDQSAAQPASKNWIRGTFQGGVDAATSGWGSDVNLNQSLSLQVDPPQWDKLHLRGFVWLNEDINIDEHDNSALRDINDAFHKDFRSNFLYLYADVDDLWGTSTLRIGRQRIQEGAAFNRIDGVYFKQELNQWEWYIFGGTRASLFRSPFEDPVFGGGAAYRPTDTTRIALDAYYGFANRYSSETVDRGPIADLLHLSYPREIRDSISDSLVSLSVWQTICPSLTLYGRYNYQGGEGDDMLLTANGAIAPWDLSYDVSYHRQLNSVGDHVDDLSVYYRILGTFEPYDDIRIALHKPLTKKIVLSLEGEHHNSFGDKRFTANEDYDLLSTILAADDVWHGFGGQIALERWFVHGSDGIWTVAGEINRKWKGLQVAVGTDFQKYQDRLVQYNPWMLWLDQLRVTFIPGQYATYNPFVIFFGKYVAEEQNNVHSIYARAKWAITPDQDLMLRVTFERDDSPESPYWRVQAQYAIRF